MVVQFLRFIVVGGVGTSAHYLVLISLVQFAEAWPVLASGVGFVVGAVTNYYLNYVYTFKSSKRHHEAILKFFAIAIAGLGLNSLVMALAIEMVALHYLVAQAFATSIVLVWNFFGNRMWTFKEGSYER